MPTCWEVWCPATENRCRYQMCSQYRGISKVPMGNRFAHRISRLAKSLSKGPRRRIVVLIIITIIPMGRLERRRVAWRYTRDQIRVSIRIRTNPLIFSFYWIIRWRLLICRYRRRWGEERIRYFCNKWAIRLLIRRSIRPEISIERTWAWILSCRIDRVVINIWPKCKKYQLKKRRILYQSSRIIQSFGLKKKKKS